MNILDGDANIFEDDFPVEPVKQESEHFLDHFASSQQQNATTSPLQHGLQHQQANADTLTAGGLSILQQTLQQPEQQIQVSSIPNFTVAPVVKDDASIKKEQFNILNSLSASKHTELAQQLFGPVSPANKPVVKQEPAQIHVTAQNVVPKAQSPFLAPVGSAAPATPQTHKIIVSSSGVAPVQTVLATPDCVTQSPPPQQQQQQQIIINSLPQQQSQPRVTSLPQLTTSDIITLSQQLNAQQLQVDHCAFPINLLIGCFRI